MVSDLQKGPGLRTEGGVALGLENEGSEDSLRRKEGPPPSGPPHPPASRAAAHAVSGRCASLRALPWVLVHCALQTLPEPAFSRKGEGWVE